MRVRWARISAWAALSASSALRAAPTGETAHVVLHPNWSFGNDLQQTRAHRRGRPARLKQHQPPCNRSELRVAIGHHDGNAYRSRHR